MMKYSLPLLLLFGFLAACVSNSPAPDMSEDGLSLVKNSNFKTLYIRQGSDFKQYNDIQFEPITLSYSDEHRNKLPSLRDEDFQFSEKEMAYFQERANKGFSEGFTKPENAQAGLIVRSTISDFYLTAPIKNSIIQPDKSFVHESSRMKIITELIDASSQQVLLRATENLKTGDFPSNNPSNLNRMNSVTYWQDVYREFRRWGIRLKNANQ